MNFLVTGGAGFIGSHVCEALLQRAHTVTVIDDLNPFYDPALKRRNIAEIQQRGGSFRFFEVDVVDRRAVDAVFAATRLTRLFTSLPAPVCAQASRNLRFTNGLMWKGPLISSKQLVSTASKS